MKTHGRGIAEVVKSERYLVAVIGKIPEASGVQDCSSWIAAHCERKNLVAPGPDRIYAKGAFKGIVFAKFAKPSDRDSFVDSIRELKRQQPENAMWAAPDQPVDVRTSQGVLFSFKKVLVNWGYNKSAVKVDVEASALSVAGKIIVKACALDHRLTLQWQDGDGESWETLQLITRCLRQSPWSNQLFRSVLQVIRTFPHAVCC